MKAVKIMLVLAMVLSLGLVGCGNKWYGVTGGGKMVNAVLIEEPEVQVVKADPTTVRIKEKVLFDFDSFKLDDQAKATVAAVASLMKKYPDTVVVLEGHTDKYGSAEYNQKLSENRANAVKDALASQGLGSRIKSSKGFGKTQLIPNLTNRENRRVLILSIGDK